MTPPKQPELIDQSASAQPHDRKPWLTKIPRLNLTDQSAENHQNKPKFNP